MYDDALKVKVRLDDGACPPSRGHAHDGGLDLRATHSCCVPAHGCKQVDTGVHIDIPSGYAGVLISKSGLNHNRSVTTTGLIDSGYTGSIKVMLHNDGDKDLHVYKGDKITQIMFVKIPKVIMILDECSSTDAREENGYGSTGR